MTPEENVPDTPENDSLDADSADAVSSAATEQADASSETISIDADRAEAAGEQADAGDPPVDPRVDEVLGDIDGAAASADEPAPDDDLQARLIAAEARADENWDRLLRMQADMENKSKRAQRDVQNARKFALEGIANDLLPIKDSLEMGLQAAGEEAASVESIREGSELTLKMLASALEKHNVVEIDPVGEKFDPEFHQAMSMQPGGEGVEPNTVISVMQKGYTLNDRLIRPALVMVAKG